MSNAQEHIMYTMIRLMDMMPLDKIKVADIVSAGAINRKTFYYHFHGIEDLLQWMTARKLDALDLNQASPQNWKEKIGSLTACIAESSSFFHAVFSSKYAPMIESWMISKLGRCMRTFIDNCITEAEARRGSRIMIESSYKEHIYNYYSRGVFSLITDWINTSCRESPGEFLKIVDHLTSDTIFNVIDAFSPSST